MTQFDAINVVIEGKSTTDSGEYEITAVNDSGKVQEFTAGALNLNGHAMATSSMEIGEYGETITVTQEEGSRYINFGVRYQ